MRRKKDNETGFSVESVKYLDVRKKTKKQIQKTHLQHKDNNTSPMLDEAEAISMSSLESLLLFICAPKENSRCSAISKLILPFGSPMSLRILDKVVFINLLTNMSVRRAGGGNKVIEQGYGLLSWSEGCNLLACPLQAWVSWFLDRRAPREAGFTEQRQPLVLDSGGITGCRTSYLK
ncbi:hypothetical protein V8G54_036020 [Vigna mungo]|uniref:Uncharacterized protein n=1 Tax=Vigna mungo TaxID=3915 RepID=A0AAQ3RDX7_VIGMU